MSENYRVINGWLAVAAGGCTCSIGRLGVHASGCGWEPIRPVEELLRDAAPAAPTDVPHDRVTLARLAACVDGDVRHYHETAAAAADLQQHLVNLGRRILDQVRACTGEATPVDAAGLRRPVEEIRADLALPTPRLSDWFGEGDTVRAWKSARDRLVADVPALLDRLAAAERERDQLRTKIETATAMLRGWIGGTKR